MGISSRNKTSNILSLDEVNPSGTLQRENEIMKFYSSVFFLERDRCAVTMTEFIGREHERSPGIIYRVKGKKLKERRVECK